MNALLPWMEMWILCLALYALAKSASLVGSGLRLAEAGGGRIAAYLLLWPGMEAERFGNRRALGGPTSVQEWLQAVAKTGFGAVLTWGLAREVFALSPGLAGWTGMVGLVFVLHFGVFHLASLVWRAAGVDAPPIMWKPHRATSLAEFWGQRWNRAFHLLVVRFVFRPLARRLGATAALWLGFFASGVVHDLVISVPARAGYGLPTFYFLIQALGITLERTPWARTRGLGRGWRGWMATMLFVAAPVGLLFHGPFIARVILPGLRDVGAL